MGGKSAKAKGANAEREVVEILKAAGYDVHKQPHSGALSWLPGDVAGFPGCFIEVKRQEALRIAEWCGKAESQAEGKPALLIFRRSREPWRVCLRLHDFLRFLED